MSVVVHFYDRLILGKLRFVQFNRDAAGKYLWIKYAEGCIWELKARNSAVPSSVLLKVVGDPELRTTGKMFLRSFFNIFFLI